MSPSGCTVLFEFWYSAFGLPRKYLSLRALLFKNQDLTFDLLREALLLWALCFKGQGLFLYLPRKILSFQALLCKNQVLISDLPHGALLLQALLFKVWDLIHLPCKALIWWSLCFDDQDLFLYLPCKMKCALNKRITQFGSIWNHVGYNLLSRLGALVC